MSVREAERIRGLYDGHRSAWIMLCGSPPGTGVALYHTLRTGQGA